MATRRFAPGAARILPAACLLLAACTRTNEPPNGDCTVEQTLTVACNVADGGVPQNPGLTGYACTGTARPDQTTPYGDVPNGVRCAGQIQPPDGGLAAGAQAYCCTSPGTKTNNEQLTGSCTVDQTLTTGCNGTTDGGAPQNLGLTGYTCTGNARPDLNATFAGGVPQGMICANQIPPTDGGAPASPQNYCCTNADTTCAYDPTAVCDPGTYAYECQNLNRPESYNPAIKCGQGVRGTALVDYCCSGTALPAGCGEQDGLAACSPGLVGWQCPIIGSEHILPKGQDLMSNKSRADQYYLLCSIPQVAPSGKVDTFCCYPPAQIPPGGSCTEDVYVPNCNPLTQFGFACSGRDTPADDFPPIVCPNGGTPGTSMAGYQATLYCCNFVNGSN